MKIYIVHEFCVEDYEMRWQEYHTYYHEENALKKLQDIKEQDMMPIVKEKGYVIQCDRPRHFEGGRELQFEKEMVFVRVIETTLSDYTDGNERGCLTSMQSNY